MLVGRSSEVEALGRLLDAAVDDSASAALLLHGEAGVGKSALLGHVADDATQRGMRVLRARGVESESDIPFAGLQELVAPLLGLRDRLPEPQSRALGAALALEPGGGEDRFAVAAALLSLLAVAAEDGPLLAAVDDVQWLDVGSREAVLFAARRIGAEGIVLLLGARDGTGASLEDALVARRRIDGLDDAQARELVTSRVSGPIAPSVVEELVRTSGGNPLALVELPGLLSREQRIGRAPLPPRLPPGQGVERAFAQRLEALSEPARQAALLASAMQAGALEVFERALQADGLDADALEEAERAGVLTVDDGRVGFPHPLLRSVAYHAAPGSRRRVAHVRLAEVAPDVRLRAWHLAIAAVEPDEEVAATLEEAARDARARGGPAAAALANTRAAELTPDPGEAARRRLEAAQDAIAAGAVEQASTLLEQAASAATGPLAAWHARLLGSVGIRAGQAREATAGLLHAADSVRDAEPVVAATLLLEAAGGCMVTGDMETLVNAAGEALELLSGEGLEPLAGVARLVLAAGLTAGGDSAAAAEHFDASAAFLEHAPFAAATAELTAMGGQCLLWLGRRDEAKAVLDRIVTAAREASAPAVLIFPLAARADVHWRTGAWDRALGDAAEAVRLARETANHGLLAHAAATLAKVEAGRGSRDDARRHAAESLAIAGAAGAEAIAVHGHFALGLAALTAGRLEEAADELRRAGELAARGGNDDVHWVPWRGDLAEALARSGAREDAAAQVAELEARGEAQDSTWAQGVALRVRGLLAADGAHGVELLERSVATLEQDGQPFEVARSQLALGERLRRERERQRSREPLERAIEAFEGLGAVPWAARAREELEASGRRARSRKDHSEADELTPGELQIALRVADGMTNREVAGAIFVSPKTVEHHLTAIYRKLGVRSRTELARAMRDVEPAAA